MEVQREVSWGYGAAAARTAQSASPSLSNGFTLSRFSAMWARP
ncbi:MAG: hypothetical protein RQ839_07530 [Thermoproteus sp.]|nr:hypothetical protein [Thermoproteus sp.]MDT7882526.1 hypothetical protein [Thermoproteus sp.]